MLNILIPFLMLLTHSLTAVIPEYEIPAIRLKLDPVKKDSLAETHGKPPKTDTLTRPAPLTASDTSYSSPIKRPLLIEAAPLLKDSKVATADSFLLMPPLRSAWDEKFQPLAPQTLPRPRPQPLPSFHDDTQPFQTYLQAHHEPILIYPAPTIQFHDHDLIAPLLFTF